MALDTPVELLQGSLTLLFVLISIILGLTIMLKYRQYKTRSLLLVGISLIFLISPYWPDAINFILLVAGNPEIDVALYLFIATAFVAPIHVTWIIAFTDMKYRDKQKTIVLIFVIEAIIYEAILLSTFLLDPTLAAIGSKESTFVVQYSDLIMIYLIISIAMFMITGLLMASDALKSDNKEIQLKGKLLLMGFVTFAIGTMLDVLFADDPSEITIGLARVFVILGLFLLYMGFTLPNFAKKLFLK